MAQNEMKTGLVEEKLIYKTHLKYHDREGQFAIMVPPHIQIYCSMQGWRSGESAVVRALASHQCGPGSIPRSGVICGLSLLVLFSAPRGFLRVLRFPLSSKTTI